MHTYFISQDQADVYLRGFLHELGVLGDECALEERCAFLNNVTWVTAGGSGKKILENIKRLIEKDLVQHSEHPTIAKYSALLKNSTPAVLHADISRKVGEVTAILSVDEPLPNRDVIIVDDVSRSGLTIKAVHDKLLALTPKTITSYTLAVKSGSVCFPSHFSIMTDVSDYIYVLRDQVFPKRLTSNHLYAKGERVCRYDREKQESHLEYLCRTEQCGLVLKMREEDAQVIKGNEQRRRQLRLYVCEVIDGKIGAFVLFELVPSSRLCIIHAFRRFRSGIGTTAPLSLLRFIEIYARHCQCLSIEVAGEPITDAVSWMFVRAGFIYQAGKLCKSIF